MCNQIQPLLMALSFIFLFSTEQLSAQFLYSPKNIAEVKQLSGNKEQVIILDSRVSNLKHFMEEFMLFGFDIWILERETAPIKQISDILANYKNISRLLLLSHGGSGTITLGDTVINHKNLSTYRSDLIKWKKSFRDNADILLFGCLISKSESGISFINKLALYTGLDIASSTDITGNARLGGDWTLEYSVGQIAPFPFDISKYLKYYPARLTLFSWETIPAGPNTQANSHQETISGETLKVSVTGNPQFGIWVDVGGQECNSFGISGNYLCSNSTNSLKLSYDKDGKPSPETSENFGDPFTLHSLDIATFVSTVTFRPNGNSSHDETISFDNFTTEPFTFIPNNKANFDSLTTLEIFTNNSLVIDNIELSPKKTNVIPNPGDNIIFPKKDQQYIFSLADFPFSDSDPNDSLNAVKFELLPNNGRIFLDSNPVNEVLDSGELITRGQIVNATEITGGHLRYNPPSGLTGNDIGFFTYSVSDGENFSQPTGNIKLIINEEQVTLQDDGNVDNSTGQWYLLSQADNQPLSSFLNDIWTQGATGADIIDGNPNVYRYDEISGSYVGLSDLNINQPAAGYAVYVFDDDNADGKKEGFPKKLSAQGEFTTGEINFSVSRSDLADNNKEGWNLIGNPYGTEISAEKVYNILEGALGVNNVNGNYYLWNENTNSWNAKSFQGGTNFIRPYQSFFIKIMNKTPLTTVSFTDKIRESFQPIIIIGFKQTNDKKTSKLTLRLSAKANNSDLKAKHTIQFNQDANITIDRLDAYHLAPISNRYIDLYSTINEENIITNVLPFTFDRMLTFPLIMSSAISDELLLTISSFNLPEDIEISLLDRHKNEEYIIGNNRDVDFRIDINLDSSETLGGDNNSSNRDPKHSVINFVKEHTYFSDSRFEIHLNKKVLTDLDQPATNIPASIALKQNFPNPFNPQTTIQFDLPSRAHVKLLVYNLMGRKITTLINETRSAGNHKAVFDASELSSGIYLYRLVAGNQTITRKMVLLK